MAVSSKKLRLKTRCLWMQTCFSGLLDEKIWNIQKAYLQVHNSIGTAQSEMSFFNYISEECNFKKCSKEKYCAVVRFGFIFILNPVFQISCAGLCKCNSFAFCAYWNRMETAACLGWLCQVAASPCRFPESCAGDDLRQSSGSLSFPLEMFFLWR